MTLKVRITALQKVTFRELTDKGDTHYIEKIISLFDKAGAYGIQEWIGHIGGNLY